MALSRKRFGRVSHIFSLSGHVFSVKSNVLWRIRWVLFWMYYTHFLKHTRRERVGQLQDFVFWLSQSVTVIVINVSECREHSKSCFWQGILIHWSNESLNLFLSNYSSSSGLSLLRCRQIASLCFSSLLSLVAARLDHNAPGVKKEKQTPTAESRILSCNNWTKFCSGSSSDETISSGDVTGEVRWHYCVRSAKVAWDDFLAWEVCTWFWNV